MNPAIKGGAFCTTSPSDVSPTSHLIPDSVLAASLGHVVGFRTFRPFRSARQPKVTP